MEIPPPEDLLAGVRAMPQGSALLDRLRNDNLPPVHLIGGSVRDLLLGRAPREFDVVVEGDIAPVLADLGGQVREHGRFGTATVSVDGTTVDLARARRESYSRPGALPDVEPAPLSEDLARRDFTVNSGAIALNGPAPGRLSADPRFQRDLERGLLRVLHDESFLDDPTRLLRLARYASRLQFAADAHTRALAEQAIRQDALSSLSGARIGAELRLIAREPDPVGSLRALHDLGLDAPLGLDTSEAALAPVRGALALLPPDGGADRVALAAALAPRAARDTPGELRSQMDAWGFEGADREAIVLTATRARDLAAALRMAGSPSGVATAVRHAPPELVALAGALGAAEEAREWLQDLRHVRLEISGDDLLAAGIPRGEAIGRGLSEALREKLDRRISGRDEELQAALRAAAANE